MRKMVEKWLKRNSPTGCQVDFDMGFRTNFLILMYLRYIMQNMKTSKLTLIVLGWGWGGKTGHAMKNLVKSARIHTA